EVRPLQAEVLPARGGLGEGLRPFLVLVLVLVLVRSVSGPLRHALRNALRNALHRAPRSGLDWRRSVARLGASALVGACPPASARGARAACSREGSRCLRSPLRFRPAGPSPATPPRPALWRRGSEQRTRLLRRACAHRRRRPFRAWHFPFEAGAAARLPPLIRPPRAPRARER